MRLHEVLMDMITEHNYGVPIALTSKDSHMQSIHNEMSKAQCFMYYFVYLYTFLYYKL